MDSVKSEIKNIKLHTLAFIHIGNGELLQKWLDFAEKKDPKGNGSDVFILDYDKLGKKIQEDGKNLAEWVKALEGNDSEFLKLFLSPYVSKETSLRVVESYDKVGLTLKECLHDGRGLPYIPGSSIKGAIRTSVYSYLVDQNLLDKIERIFNLNSGNIFKAQKEAEKIVSKWQDDTFGKINDDIFKYLQVGDAFFRKGSEIVIDQINLNKKRNGFEIDESKRQTVEAIEFEKSSKFRIKLIQEFSKNKTTEPKSSEFRKKIDSEGMPFLFSIINQHTSSLVEKEIEFFKDEEGEVADYLANMEDLLEVIKNCIHGKECVLRIGQASGWKFITGAWTERLDENVFYELIVPMCRDQKKYKDFIFPKSRRVGDQSDLFGFVKLSME